MLWAFLSDFCCIFFWQDPSIFECLLKSTERPPVINLGNYIQETILSTDKFCNRMTKKEAKQSNMQWEKEVDLGYDVKNSFGAQQGWNLRQKKLGCCILGRSSLQQLFKNVKSEANVLASSQ